MRARGSGHGLAGTALLLALGAAPAAAGPAPASYPQSREWPTYGHDAGGMRFSPLAQITPANVGRLKVAWTYHLKPVDDAGARANDAPPDAVEAAGGGRAARAAAGPGATAANTPPLADGAASANARPGPPPGVGAGGRGFAPSENASLIVDGLLYIASPYGRVVALDATTGRERWVHKLPSGNPSTRGVEYFPGDATTPPRIVVGTSDAKLFTLDARTGVPDARFGTVALDKPPSSPAVMFGNVVIVGGRTGENAGPGVAGDVNAYDIHDGRRLWTFHTIPRPGEPNHGSWAGASAEQRSGVNVWGTMSVDAARGIVYLPIGAPSGDLFGGDRPGNDLYDTSIVALDARTGRYLWHFQVVHHDIWDYDLGSAPVLMDVARGGRRIPALGIVGKSALLYLLDRTTGKPIYGVEERPVPASDVPGERPSPTQPFPLKPPPLARNRMTAADLVAITPELAAACRRLVDDNKVLIERPPFATNPYNRSGVVFPSEIGGANWGGASFDPRLGYLFVNVNELGQIIGTKDPSGGPVDLATLVGNAKGGRQGPYLNYGPSGRFAVRIDGALFPCNRPPWGSLVAVNVNTGAIAWKVPLGVTDSLPEAVRRTGRPNIGGSIATAGGLVFIGAADDGRFRAFDARTGREVWTMRMAASGSATPSTYQGRDGRQYVVMTFTGGSNSAAPVTGDEVTAFALPAGAAN